ncbi:member RAS oncoprotein [Perkinsus olseni]|uniref:Member RAS oncoprotein n=1 Tax=Perkinsus olseni TaxID=32597 RepID=A0A7J6M0R3_PEROL|nr:member RAS oncoprotein [Perkinsus olseni]
MQVDPLFTTPTLVSASNENLMGSRRAVIEKEGQEGTTIRLIQPSANCAYIATFEAGHTSAEEVAPLQLGGQRFSLEPRVNTSDNVIRLCYFNSESKEIRVASLSTEDGRSDDVARCKLDESVRCIEWLSSNSIIVLCKDTVMELTADPLEIYRTAHIDVPRHSHTCRLRRREGVDELLVYGTGGLSVFLCSGRVTAAAQLEEGSCVFSNWLMQSAEGKSRFLLLSEQESVLITNTSGLTERRPVLSLYLQQQALRCLRRGYIGKCKAGYFRCSYEGSSITLVQTVDLEKEFTSWGASSRIRGVTFLGTSRVSLLVATTDEGDTEADDKQPFAWAQKTKAPAQWDAVTFRVQGSALDSPSLDPSIATDEALEPGSAATTSQLYAEVASLRWEMNRMRDTVNKIGADVAAVRRLNVCLLRSYVDSGARFRWKWQKNLVTVSSSDFELRSLNFCVIPYDLYATRQEGEPRFVTEVLVGKVIVVGPASVGKTCLVTRFVDDVFDANTQSTLGCDSKEKTLNVTGVAEPIKLILYDTAGQERFAQLAGSYYRQADVVAGRGHRG